MPDATASKTIGPGSGRGTGATIPVGAVPDSPVNAVLCRTRSPALTGGKVVAEFWMSARGDATFETDRGACELVGVAWIPFRTSGTPTLLLAMGVAVVARSLDAPVKPDRDVVAAASCAEAEPGLELAE